MIPTRHFALLCIVMLLTSLFVDVCNAHMASRPSQQSIRNRPGHQPTRSRPTSLDQNLPNHSSINNNNTQQQRQSTSASTKPSTATTTTTATTTPTTRPPKPTVSNSNSKLSLDTITTGAWAYSSNKSQNKTELWAAQSSLAQAIGVDMISTIAIPMSLYVMPVGYHGDGHLGMTIPEPVWKHWAAGSSVSRPERIINAQKMPIYNSASGNNAQVTNSDRLVDHGFFSDIVYDLNVDILPSLPEITECILYLYRTLHRFETAAKHANMISGKEASPHMFIEPQIITHLLQTLYISASEFIDDLQSSYTLTIMNPKRDWIIESLTLNDQLDKVLLDLLQSATKQQEQQRSQQQKQSNGPNSDQTSANEPDNNRLHQTNYATPPFHGYRHGMSLTEMFTANHFETDTWAKDVLRIINSESTKIDRRLDIESDHIAKETIGHQSPWGSMSLFDYLDEKIMLYAAKRDEDERESRTYAQNHRSGGGTNINKKNDFDIESIFGRNIKQSSTVWLDRLETALAFITNADDVHLSRHHDAIPPSELPQQDNEQEIKNNNPDEEPDQLSKKRRRGLYLDPITAARQRMADEKLKKDGATIVPKNRISHNKQTIKLVSSLTAAHVNENNKLDKGLGRIENSQLSSSQAMVQGTFTSINIEQHQKYKMLLKVWSNRVKNIFAKFGAFLSQINKSGDGEVLADSKLKSTKESEFWLQGMSSTQQLSLISHLFPTQLAFQSYQSGQNLATVQSKQYFPTAESWSAQDFTKHSDQIPPLNHQSCLTETYIGTNRTAVIDVTAGPFSWGYGRGHSGDYGNGDPNHSHTAYKSHSALPNADHLANIRNNPGSQQYSNTNREDVVMKFYDIDGIKGVKLDLSDIIKSMPTPSPSSPTSSQDNNQSAQTIGNIDGDEPLETHTLSTLRQEGDIVLNSNDPLVISSALFTDDDPNPMDELLTLVVLEEGESDSIFSSSERFFSQEYDTDDLIDDHSDQGLDQVLSPLSQTPQRFRRKAQVRQTGLHTEAVNAATPPASSSQQDYQQQVNGKPAEVRPNDSYVDKTPSSAHQMPGKNDLGNIRRVPQATPPKGNFVPGSGLNGGKARSKSTLFEAALEQMRSKGTWPSHEELRQRQKNGQLENPVAAESIPPDTNPQPLKKRTENIFPSADALERMLREAGLDSNGQPVRKDSDPGKPTVTPTPSPHGTGPQSTNLEHDLIAQIIDSLEIEEKAHEEQQKQMGDDVALDNTIVSGKKIADEINKVLNKRKTAKIDEHGRRLDRMNRAKADIDTPNKTEMAKGQSQQPSSTTGPITSDKISKSKSKRTAAEVENELVMLEQLLQSDLCINGLLDCSKYQGEYDTLKRIYSREVLEPEATKPERAPDMTHITGDENVNLDSKVQSPSDRELDDQDLEKKVIDDIEVPLTLQDGLQDVELADIIIPGLDLGNDWVELNKQPTTNNKPSQSRRKKPEFERQRAVRESTDEIDYDAFDQILESLNKMAQDKNRKQNNPTNEEILDKVFKQDIDVNLGSTTDAALGANTLNTYDRLQSVLDAMPGMDLSNPTQLAQAQRALQFGNDKINGGFSLSAIDYYMSHINSAINNYVNNIILPPMDLAGVDKLYYRRVHFTLYLFVDHDDFNPLDLYNIPYYDVKTNTGYKFNLNQKDNKAEYQEKQYTNHDSMKQPQTSDFMRELNVNMWQLFQLAIEQVRIRGQQFSYSIQPINLLNDPEMYTAIENAMTTTVSPSYYSNPSNPIAYTHTYINSDLILPGLLQHISRTEAPLPKNTRHIPIVMFSLTPRQQPILLDIFHQAVVKNGIVIAIQTPHSPSTIAQIDTNFQQSQSALTNKFIPHTPQCQQTGGYKLYMDPRDPISPLLYSTLSLLFSTHTPQYGLFVPPNVTPLSLSLPRVTIDAYQRNYLLTAIRTATKITNLATYTLSLVDSDETNACILDEVYTPQDSTPRQPFIYDWNGKKLYKLVRKAQRSVRFHLFQMRQHISHLDVEGGVKYIRTLVGSAWQYRYLVDVLLTRIDKCGYASAYNARLSASEATGMDLMDPATYGLYFDPEAFAGTIGTMLGLVDEDSDYGYILSPRPSHESKQSATTSSWSVARNTTGGGSGNRRGIGMYVWIIVLVIIIGLFFFRAINDVVVTVQNKKDD